MPLPIPEMSSLDLLLAVQEMADTVAQDPENSTNAKYLADLVREQISRQRKAQRRVSEYMRQKKLYDESYAQRNKTPGDVIETLHEDKYAHRISLRYSDIEALAPIIDWDSEGAFWAEQDRRLALVLERNPKLTDRQKATLEQIAHQERRVSYSSKYGANYGALDGRVVNGLEKRGLVTSWSYGTGWSKSGFLIIADPDAEKKQ